MTCYHIAVLRRCEKSEEVALSAIAKILRTTREQLEIDTRGRKAGIVVVTVHDLSVELIQSIRGVDSVQCIRSNG